MLFIAGTGVFLLPTENTTVSPRHTNATDCEYTHLYLWVLRLTLLCDQSGDFIQNEMHVHALCYEGKSESKALCFFT
jgi:hypothetical protein